MSSFCPAKATHIFFSKRFQHICTSLDVNFNELLTNDVVSFEHLGPGVLLAYGPKTCFLQVWFCLKEPDCLIHKVGKKALMPYANSYGPDQSTHLDRLISTSVH